LLSHSLSPFYLFSYSLVNSLFHYSMLSFSLSSYPCLSAPVSCFFVVLYLVKKFTTFQEKKIPFDGYPGGYLWWISFSNRYPFSDRYPFSGGYHFFWWILLKDTSYKCTWRKPPGICQGISIRKDVHHGYPVKADIFFFSKTLYTRATSYWPS